MTDRVRCGGSYKRRTVSSGNIVDTVGRYTIAQVSCPDCNRGLRCRVSRDDRGWQLCTLPLHKRTVPTREQLLVDESHFVKKQITKARSQSWAGSREALGRLASLEERRLWLDEELARIRAENRSAT